MLIQERSLHSSKNDALDGTIQCINRYFIIWTFAMLRLLHLVLVDRV